MKKQHFISNQMNCPPQKVKPVVSEIVLIVDRTFFDVNVFKISFGLHDDKPFLC